MNESFEKISREVQYGLNPYPASHDVHYPVIDLWDDDPWTCMRIEKILRSIIHYKGDVKEYTKALLLACHRAAEKSSEEMYKDHSE